VLSEAFLCEFKILSKKYINIILKLMMSFPAFIHSFMGHISELVMESVRSNVACVGLLYDQLAAVVCTCTTLDITFLVRCAFSSLFVTI
jgi:hypothetical protein